jgi:hypothetical protein
MSAFGLISVVSRHATDIIPVILQVNLSTLWSPTGSDIMYCESQNVCAQTRPVHRTTR